MTTQDPERPSDPASRESSQDPVERIAIIGMAGRFPGARDTDSLWRLLDAGQAATSWPGEEALRAAGVSAEDLADPHYVRATLPLPGMEDFDASFFGLSARDGQVMDPQHRHFLECAWEALEHAGHRPDRFDGAIGVFGGCGMQAYLPLHLLANAPLVRSMGLFLLRHTGNDKDFLATRVSYLLDLRGPSIGIQTACSTSLVAVHVACQSLLSGECDMALAGAASIELPHGRGYRHVPGEILSADGHCRAFDDAASGTLFGSGAGIVVLRRLSDALRDGDHVHAVILASAVNNDGRRKAGYLAPSVDGQAGAAAEALALSGLAPGDIDYIEAHGTGTPVGDPIEVAALAQAYAGAALGAIGLGSIKTNIGHLDTAAGIAGLIKVCLALRHGRLPASLHFSQPNHRFDLARLPLRVVSQPTAWPAGARVRRAAVNALGVGGTNAHVIVEEAPQACAPADAPQPWQLVPLSAATASSLQALRDRWQSFTASPQALPPLADIAWTLQEGRRAWPHRLAFLARDGEDLARLLQSSEPVPEAVPAHALGPGAIRGQAGETPPAVVWMLPGGGAQFAGACRELFGFAAFREALRECGEALPGSLPAPLREVLSGQADEAQAAHWLERPTGALPALFMIEVALARLWESWGIRPAAVIGHSAGEHAAACIAGLLSLPDALSLVVERARLFETLEPGGMLSVEWPPERLQSLMAGLDLDLAAFNGPDLCLVSGPQGQIAELVPRLEQSGVEYRPLRLKVAAHSRALDVLAPPLAAHLSTLSSGVARVPYLSCVTAQWIQPGERLPEGYWVRHMREPVRFSQALEVLVRAYPQAALLEVGPGQGLGMLARYNGAGGQRLVLASTPRAQDAGADLAAMLASAAALWCQGVSLDWVAVRGGRRGRRVPLPTYAFDRVRHWVSAPVPAPAPISAAASSNTPASASAPQPSGLPRIADPRSWVRAICWRRQEDHAAAPHRPSRERTAGISALSRRPGRCLLVGPSDRLTFAVSDALTQAGWQVLQVGEGPHWQQVGPAHWQWPLAQASAWMRWFEQVGLAGEGLQVVVQMMAGDDRDGRDEPAAAAATVAAAAAVVTPGAEALTCDRAIHLYCDVPAAMAQALQQLDNDTTLPWILATRGGQSVTQAETASPWQALVVGACRVIPREWPGARLRMVDLDTGMTPAEAAACLAGEVDRLRGPQAQVGHGARDVHHAHDWQNAQDAHDAQEAAQGLGSSLQDLVAWRGGHRWVPHLDSVPAAAADRCRLRQGAVCLITGGLGGVGMALAQWLVESVGARLALVTRSALPPQGGASPGASADARAAGLRQLAQWRERGVELEIFEADVADTAAMTRVIRRCQQRWGGVHAVFHAAGVVDDHPVSSRTRESSRRVIGSKGQGAQVLHTLLPGPLDVFAVFSSSSIDLGPPGQLDYVAANAMAESVARGRPDALVVRWGAWRDVGMLARARGASATLATCSGAAHALLGPGQDSPQGRVFEATYDPSTMWMLDEHRVDGCPVLPGAALVEIALAAWQAMGHAQGPVTMSQLELQQALTFAQGARRVRVVLQASGEPAQPGWDLRLQSRRCDAAPHESWTSHARLRLQEPAAPGATDDLPAAISSPPDSASHLAQEPWHTGPATQAGHPVLRFGPRWDCLRAWRVRDGQVEAELELSERFGADLPAWHAHPALLDIGMTIGLHLVAREPDPQHLWVPVGVDRIRWKQACPARLRSRARQVGSSPAGDGHPAPQDLVFDVELTTAEGAPVATLEGVRMARVPARAVLQSIHADTPQPQAPPHRAAVRPADLAQDLWASGIRAEDAAGLFDRVLRSREPWILASTVDPQQARQMIDRLTAAPVAKVPPRATPEHALAMNGQDSATPLAASDPRRAPADTADQHEPLDAVQAPLAAIWRELLGADQVSAQDDFFQLGGHSLVAVRLFARIRRQFGVELPLATLFEASTLGALAARIARDMPPPSRSEPVAGPNAEPSAGPVAKTSPTPTAPPAPARAPVLPDQAILPAPLADPALALSQRLSPLTEKQPALQGTRPVDPLPARPWSPLVEISRGSPSVRPLFCVHGAGGNVLNFKLIADRLPASQGVYGLQAQGVDGRLPPLESIEAMAAQYLAAIRQVQPVGPYRLAGYSAGGLIALEMAQQLKAQGKRTECLVMIDTLSPRAARAAVPWWRRLILLRHWSPGFALGWWSRRARGRQMVHRYEQARAQQAQGRTLSPELVDFHLFQNFIHAQDRYLPREWAGTLALFKARQGEMAYLNAGRCLGWERSIRGPIQVVPISGSHDSIMREPGLSELAQALGRLASGSPAASP